MRHLFLVSILFFAHGNNYACCPFKSKKITPRMSVQKVQPLIVQPVREHTETKTEQKDRNSLAVLHVLANKNGIHYLQVPKIIARSPTPVADSDSEQKSAPHTKSSVSAATALS